MSTKRAPHRFRIRNYQPLPGQLPLFSSTTNKTALTDSQLGDIESIVDTRGFSILCDGAEKIARERAAVEAGTKASSAWLSWAVAFKYARENVGFIKEPKQKNITARAKYKPGSKSKKRKVKENVSI